mmetsp:Transcript_73416/g.132187  ORF Transcript_73416/g.132187 Transcript_73416/m.132187 type:complete len:201 (-) Transcript_73416:428-1030(-)
MAWLLPIRQSSDRDTYSEEREKLSNLSHSPRTTGAERLPRPESASALPVSKALSPELYAVAATSAAAGVAAARQTIASVVAVVVIVIYAITGFVPTATAAATAAGLKVAACRQRLMSPRARCRAKTAEQLELRVVLPVKDPAMLILRIHGEQRTSFRSQRCSRCPVFATHCEIVVHHLAGSISNHQNGHIPLETNEPIWP